MLPLASNSKHQLFLCVHWMLDLWTWVASAVITCRPYMDVTAIILQRQELPPWFKSSPSADIWSAPLIRQLRKGACWRLQAWSALDQHASQHAKYGGAVTKERLSLHERCSCAAIMGQPFMFGGNAQCQSSERCFGSWRSLSLLSECRNSTFNGACTRGQGWREYCRLNPTKTNTFFGPLGGNKWKPLLIYKFNSCGAHCHSFGVVFLVDSNSLLAPILVSTNSRGTHQAL